MKDEKIQNLIVLIGRLLISFIFLTSGIHKILDFTGNVDFVASKGLPFPAFMLGVALIIELVAGLMIFLGWHTRIGAIVLSVFIIFVTLVFHHFWSYPPDQSGIQSTLFWKNLAMLGGLFYIVAFGAGKYSLDYLRYHKRR